MHHLALRRQAVAGLERGLFDTGEDVLAQAFDAVAG
jgi:hypothetical protein